MNPGKYGASRRRLPVGRILPRISCIFHFLDRIGVIPPFVGDWESDRRKMNHFLYGSTSVFEGR